MRLSDQQLESNVAISFGYLNLQEICNLCICTIYNSSGKMTVFIGGKKILRKNHNFLIERSLKYELAGFFLQIYLLNRMKLKVSDNEIEFSFKKFDV